MQNVIQIATNAGHTVQNDDRTIQNDGCTMHNVGRNTKDQRGGLRSPPGDPPTPILEKTLVSRNDF